MDWREERKQQLEVQLRQVLNDLNDYESRLISEDDPNTIRQLKQKIDLLKSHVQNISVDLDELNNTLNKSKNMASTMPDVNFEDINFVITGLLKQQLNSVETPDFSFPTNPKEKMSKNGLTMDIKFLMDMGLGKAKEVRNFIDNTAKINLSNVPEKLKEALNSEYDRLIIQGVTGDQLFLKLYEFS